MIKKQILLVVSAVTVIVLSCVAVALVTNYLVNREQPRAALPPVSPSSVVSQPATLLNEPGKGDVRNVAVEPVKSENTVPMPPLPDQANAVTAPDENTVVPVSVNAANAGAEDNEQKPSLDEKSVPPAVPEPPVVPMPFPAQPASTTTVTVPLPPFTPVTNATGPVAPPPTGTQDTQALPADISSFVPQASATGPIPENTAAPAQSLPQFAPVQSQTGPVKTDNK